MLLGGSFFQGESKGGAVLPAIFSKPPDSRSTILRAQHRPLQRSKDRLGRRLETHSNRLARILQGARPIRRLRRRTLTQILHPNSVHPSPGRRGQKTNNW
ncbi:uncharacterized protein Dvir_GJ26478 [Drosophila virilis]|uniref:Uncharacterized protein n=1 Tax=Drosophila virilis TaxID=7244 RepID=A0A0Q9WPM3_DROVI|nr:uncharacterized protein Dvir_GJ26478 [Drosophila virilis]